MGVDQDAKKEKGVTRRGFLKLASAAGLTGATMVTSGCLIDEERIDGKGWLPQQYQAAGSFPVQARGRVAIDPTNPSLVRDDQKCILCGQCIEVCRGTQGVFGNYSLPLKNDFICVHCGQCSLLCPTASITERSDVTKVKEALADPEKVVFVQTAPATRVALGEEFGMEPGTWVQGQQVAALKELGFDGVFDTLFTADLTIMEEGSELIKKLKESEKMADAIPQITSCCPGWIKFCEYFYPDLIQHLSSAKSPQQMFGTLVKTYYAEQQRIDPGKIVSVAVMPCTAKKFEASRSEMNDVGRYWNRKELRDVDLVLTTRELARLIKEQGMNLERLPEQRYDSLMGEGSGAGLIFGSTGGVMQAAVRSVYFLLTGKDCPAEAFTMKTLNGLEGIKEASVPIPGYGNINIAVVHGLHNAHRVMEGARRKEVPYHFVEIMACPGGCVGGGGQPRTTVPPSDGIRLERIASLMQRDATYTLRESHENKEVLALYETFLERPLSEKAYSLLHTKYTSRGHLVMTEKMA